MSSKNVIIVKYFLIFLILNSVQCSKLNVARVLLPIFDDFSTNFTIQGTDDSCYRWSTTRNDVLQITPIDEHFDLKCSTKIRVSTLTKEKGRVNSDILAEDVNTRQIMRCVVIVDAIQSLAIVTTTRELFLEEAPEVFEVRAYDDQGNEFTSLEGIQFEWFIAPTGPSKDLVVLRFMTFGESPYETPEFIKDIEANHKKGHKVLLEGVKTGMSKVTVKLPHSDYTEVRSNEIQLQVVANLMIIPSDVYIMLGDIVSFKVLQTSYGTTEEVELTNSQYYLDVVDRVVAKSEKYNGDIVGLREGKTKIVLHDRNVDENEGGLKLPTATLTVVKPAYMMLSLMPHKNWAVLVSEAHDILAEVYSSDNHKLYLGPGVTIQTQVDDKFRIKERSNNGSWSSGWSQTEGIAPVSAVLTQVTNPKTGTTTLSSPLGAQNEMVIYPRIVLMPSEIILPWDPVARPKYDFEIKASGADGRFLWSSTNHTVGVVTQTGKVHTHFHGYFEVSAAMQKNHHNRQTAKVHILPPSRLEIVEFVMEAEVGTVVYLHLALYADKPEKDGQRSQIPFSLCQELPFNVKMSDPRYKFNRTSVAPNVGVSCGNIGVFSNTVGAGSVTVSYIGDGKLLQDTVSVSYYMPLKLISPTGNIILAVGTSINLIFTGGPKHVVGTSHSRVLTTQYNQTVEAVDTTDTHNMPDREDYIVIKVLCQELGTSNVELRISNAPNIPNCKISPSSVIVPVTCGKPRSMSLQPEIKVADVSSCPMDLSADRVVVHSNDNIELAVTVRDENGSAFLNISSLKIDWSVDPISLGKIISMDGVFERPGKIGTAEFPGKSYQNITPLVETGILNVVATIVGYRKDILDALHVIGEWPEFLDEEDKEKQLELTAIRASISLYLVDDTVVTPNIISIYNHPTNKHFVDVKQGSGYYEIALNRDDIAEVKYLPKSRQLQMTPLGDGELSIKLIDLCLVGRPAMTAVFVVSVHAIRVEMSDKVEIGKCISCIVKLYDEFDNLLQIPDLAMIQLSGKMEANIANIKRLPGEPETSTPPGEIHYILTGVELGDTKLMFNIGEPNQEGYVGSAPMDLQVFPPLRLFPRNATITVGSQLQYSSKGGPQPTPVLEYIVENDKLAKISGNGIVRGLALCQVKVKARAVGTNPTTGQRVIYTEDTVDLKVIPISGIKISAPLSRFEVGSSVPMWANGIPEILSPLVLATIDPPLRFDWGIEDADVVSISGVFHLSGILYEPEDMLSIRVLGRSAGRSNIYLNVTIPAELAGSRYDVVYFVSEAIEVFEKLVLTMPIGLTSQALLLAPYSTLQLKTNMDGPKLKYRLLGDNSAIGTDLQDNSHTSQAPLVIISKTGLLESFGTLGSSMLLISYVDEYGLKQTLTIPIEVKPIHYMMLEAGAKWKVDSANPITVIPLGTEFELEAHYFDNTGVEFQAGSVELQVRTSRFDLIRVKLGNDNTSLIISTKKPGITAIKVWSDSIQKTADYVKLHVEQTITPLINHVTTGDIICLSSPLTSSRPYMSSSWSTMDTSVINIQPDSGIATAVGARGGHASLSHSLHPHAPLQLHVNAVANINVEIPLDILTNSRTATYNVPVILQSQSDTKKTNLINGWNCKDELNAIKINPPFICDAHLTNSSDDVAITDVFDVEAKFNYITGVYYCDFTPTPHSSKMYNTLQSNVSLRITVRGSDIEWAEFNILFIPSVYAPEELLLDDSNKGLLVINGLDSVLDEVEVSPIDASMLAVYNMNRPEVNIATYEIELLDYHNNIEEMRDAMSLNVYSKATNNNIKVHVSSGSPFSRHECSPGSSPLLSFLHAYRQFLSIIVAAVVVVFASFYFYSTYVRPTINVNVISNGTNIAPLNTSYYPRSPQYQKTPNTPFKCAAMPNRTSPNTSNLNTTQTPVYGDPSMACNCSPELRRNRRYM